MDSLFDRRLALLDQPENRQLLKGIRRGLEKESLRTDPAGYLALTPHPEALGSALTNSAITTDFSEALLEFITPVCATVDEALAALDEVHRFTYSELGNEQLWTASMPCRLPQNDDDIPLAQYGSSNSAKMKTLYRRGLGHRYGRSMQTIAGIHYNVSFPKQLWNVLQEEEGLATPQQSYINRGYFSLIRNFRRYTWLLVYLFGASPALCQCFVREANHRLQKLGTHTLYLPDATCLRMGDLGYRSAAQRQLNVCFNTLDSYINTLKEGITQPYSDYERIGLKKDGEYQQLSTALLQIENEFYGSIRPKRVTRSGEIPLAALQRDGIEYIEVRCLDVNPYYPLGVDAESLDFIDCFLLFCLVNESPQCDDDDRSRISDNVQKVVNHGRDPLLVLQHDDDVVSLKQWASECMLSIRACSQLLDKIDNGNRYLRAWQAQQDKIDNVNLTPSARMLEDLRLAGGYYEFVLEKSTQHAQDFLQRPLTEKKRQAFADLANASLEKRALIEAADNISFEKYLEKFFAQYDLL